MQCALGTRNAHRLLSISPRWLIQPHDSVLECVRLDAAFTCRNNLLPPKNIRQPVKEAESPAPDVSPTHPQKNGRRSPSPVSVSSLASCVFQSCVSRLRRVAYWHISQSSPACAFRRASARNCLYSSASTLALSAAAAAVWATTPRMSVCTWVVEPSMELAPFVRR
jgi:hypothetical protein